MGYLVKMLASSEGSSLTLHYQCSAKSQDKKGGEFGNDISVLY